MNYLKYFFLLLATHGYSQNVVSYEFERYISDWQKEHDVPVVAIGIIENGRVQYTEVFGQQSNGIPADKQTIFTVASLTKPVFATIVLNLIEHKKLKLDEPVFKYYIDPDVKDDIRLKMLTPRFILSHQSGFVNWRNMSHTKKLAFNFTPGEQYLYSGEGYEYLRHAIENKTNKKLTALAHNTLFQPLGLKAIDFVWNEQWNRAKLAIPHNNLPNTELNAASGLLTTIEDYTRFCAFVVNGEGLSNSLFKEIIKPQVKVKEGLYYGLGWEIIPNLSNNESVMMHSGDGDGVKTLVVLLPKSKRGIVVFTNGNNGYKVYEKVVSSYLKEGKQIFELKNRKLVPEEKYSISFEDLKNYTGTFKIKENVTFDVITDTNTLKLIIPGQSPFKLVAQSKNEFLVDDEIKVEFVWNESNKLESVITYQHGIKSYQGNKVK